MKKFVSLRRVATGADDAESMPAEPQLDLELGSVIENHNLPLPRLSSDDCEISGRGIRRIATKTVN